MTKILIVGKTNTGKSLLLIALAEELGARRFSIIFRTPRGDTKKAILSPNLARFSLVNQKAYYTKVLQEVSIPVYRKSKGGEKITIIDSPALSDGVHADPYIRKTMLLTLKMLPEVDTILHLIDLSASSEFYPWQGVNRQLSYYKNISSNYLLVANKTDLPEAKKGLSDLSCGMVHNLKYIPVSALRKKGLKELVNKILKLSRPGCFDKI